MLTAQRDFDPVIARHSRGIGRAAAALFVYASWLGYHKNNQAVAERQIDRTRDVVTSMRSRCSKASNAASRRSKRSRPRHADERIAANEENFHNRSSGCDSSDQIKSVWIFDRHGTPWSTALAYPAPSIDFSDCRFIFQVQLGLNRDIRDLSRRSACWPGLLRRREPFFAPRISPPAAIPRRRKVSTA